MTAGSGPDVARHYSHGGLLTRLNVALAADGVDPAHPTIEALAPYDQFHSRGMEATIELADRMPVRATDHVLDVGCGIGGPARYFAHRFGCRVTGIDLTLEFCEVARELTRLLRLDERVSFDHGDALHLPYEDASFDGVYSMNVSMNIADKAGLYREMYRVLRPGAWLVLSEIAKGAGGPPDYPTPWASRADASFLWTPEETRPALVAAGFDVERIESTREAALEFGARSRAIVERGGKAPARAVMLIHGDMAQAVMTNSARALADGRLDAIELFARKR